MKEQEAFIARGVNLNNYQYSTVRCLEDDFETIHKMLHSTLFCSNGWFYQRNTQGVSKDIFTICAVIFNQSKIIMPTG